MGAAQFQGYALDTGVVDTEQMVSGALPAGSVVHRGMAVSSTGKVLITQDIGQARVFMNGIAFEASTGAVLYGTSAPFNISHGGLLVDANGAVAMVIQTPDVIHQGVGLTNAGELCVTQLGCFFVISAVIGNPEPEVVIVTFNEAHENCNTTNPSPTGFRFRSNGQLLTDAGFLTNPTPQSIRFRATDLFNGDAPSYQDTITMDYVPGNCAKTGDPSCDLQAFTNYPVDNQMWGVTTRIIGNVADNIIEVSFISPAATVGNNFRARVNGTSRGIVGTAVVGGTVQLTLTGTVGDSDTVDLSHIDVQFGATAVDGRELRIFENDPVVNEIDTVAPTVPQNLVATATGQTTVNLTWDPSTDAKSGVKEYVVYRASVEIDRVPHPTTTYQDTGLSPETAYNYTVSAVDNKNNESSQSVGDSATTWQPAPLVTAAEVGNVADNIVVVTFDREVVATSYTAGWSFTEDSSPVTISSANKTQATEVQFTLSADISDGTTVAYSYNASSGDYENTDGVDMENQSGSVTNNVAPPVTGPDFVAFAADNDGVIKALETGTGSVTFGRSTAATVIDFEGLVKTAIANELRFENARRVENIALSTEDFDNSEWKELGTAAITGSGEGTITGLDTSTSNLIRQQLLVGQSTEGEDFCFTVDIKAEGANIGKDIRYRLISISGGSTASKIITVTLTGSFQRFTTEALSYNPDNTGVEFRIYGAAANSADGCIIRYPQVEKVTGQTNQNPSEYVSVGVGTGSELAASDATDNLDYCTPLGSNTASLDDGGVKITYVNNINGARFVLQGGTDNITDGLVENKTYEIAFQARCSTSAVECRYYAGDDFVAVTETTWTQKRILYTASSGYQTIDTRFFWAAAGELWIKDISIKEADHGAFVDGVKYFNYENGNTVASNVVTETKGADLTTAWRALFEPPATNYTDTDDDLTGGAETVDLTAGGTGDYTLSVSGTAAVTVAAGTATGTGFGQATAGSPVTFNLTGAGTVTLTLDSGTLGTDQDGNYIKQVEKASVASSFIPSSGVGSTTRTADDGSPMFDYANWNQSEGTLIFDLTMADAIDQGIFNIANAEAGVISYDTTNEFQTDDGTNQANVDPSLSANLGDTIRFAVLYSSAGGLAIGYKNITDAGSWVWDTDSASFDGAFATDSVFNVLYGIASPSTMKDLHYYSSAQSKAFIEANY